MTAPNIKMHPRHPIANPRENFRFAKAAEIPKCGDHPMQMKLSFIYMRPSRSND